MQCWLQGCFFLLVAGLLLGTARLIEKRFVAKNFGVVESQLIYRSGQIQAGLIEQTLEEKRIRVVVNLQGVEHDNADQLAEAKAIETFEIESHRFPMAGDGVGTVEKYAQAVALLAKAEKDRVPTLIHCAAGSQRTGGTVAAFPPVGARRHAPSRIRRKPCDTTGTPAKTPPGPYGSIKTWAAIAQRLVELKAIETGAKSTARVWGVGRVREGWWMSVGVDDKARVSSHGW